MQQTINIKKSAIANQLYESLAKLSNQQVICSYFKIK